MADIQPATPATTPSRAPAVEAGLSLLRHLLSGAGGFLAALGLTADQVSSIEAIAGALIALAATVWGARDKFRAR